MEQQELLTLIERCRMGDPQAQETLVVATQNKVYYHCRKFLKNEADAQDATQDVLITMITSLDKLREPAAFWGWLNGITANRCKHLVTQGTTEWQIPEDDEGNSMLDSMETLDDQTIPDKALDNAATQQIILDIIDTLPAEQRMTVTFFYYDEMSVREIAEVMGVSEGTVKSRLNYARRTIKLEVEKLEKKDGTKLYGVSILPFLAYFLHREAQSAALSPAVSQAVTQSVLAGANASQARAAVSAAARASQDPQAAQAASSAARAAGSTAAETAKSVAAAGTKAAGKGAAKIVAAALAGTLAVGGVGAGVYVATHRDAEPKAPAPTPEPVPYTQVYAQAVRDREEGYGDYLYGLVYINEDDVPELVVEDAEKHGEERRLSIYTADPDGSLRPVWEDWDVHYGHPEYYPRANILLETTMGKEYVGLFEAYQTVTRTYYRMGASGKAEEFQSSTASPFRSGAPNPHTIRPPEVKALGEDAQTEYVEGVLTAQELLDQLALPFQAPAPEGAEPYPAG